VPPVVAQPPITTGSYRIPPSHSNVVIEPQGFVGFLVRPLIGAVPGWVVMSALLLLGFAFVGGAIWTLRSGPGSAATQSPLPKIQFLDLAFQSSPTGADVYVVGSNEYLGRTPFRRKVEYRDDRTTFVVFRLAGHLEATKEVRPEWAGSVTLQPAPMPPSAPPIPTPPPAPVPAPPPPLPTTHPGQAGASGTAEPTLDKTKTGKSRGGKVRGKSATPTGKEKTDPFESPSSGAAAEGRKASPFD
jgi:hypothetical protein